MLDLDHQADLAECDRIGDAGEGWREIECDAPGWAKIVALIVAPLAVGFGLIALADAAICTLIAYWHGTLFP